MLFLSSIKNYVIGIVMLFIGFMFWRTESQKNSLKEELNQVKSDILNSNTKTLEEALNSEQENESLEDTTRENIIKQQETDNVKIEMTNIQKQLEDSHESITIKI